MAQNYGFSTEGNTIVGDFKSQIKDRTFLITGPSEGGLGAETAISLAHGSPSKIILLGRTIAKIQPTINAISSISTSILVKFVPINLDSLSSIRAAAKQILEDDEIPNLDVVINNAAIMVCPFKTTEDGYESQFATNYLSHFLLTNLLMPKILKSNFPRVVNVSSSAHTMGSVRFHDLSFKDGQDYDVWQAYGQSKTANILFSVELNARGVKSFSLHPGSIASQLQQYVTEDIRNAGYKAFVASGQSLSSTKVKTLQQGCATTLRAALDPTLEIVARDGKESCYLVDSQIVTDKPVSEYALDKENAKKLWKLSEEMVGETFAW